MANYKDSKQDTVFKIPEEFFVLLDGIWYRLKKLRNEK